MTPRSGTAGEVYRIMMKSVSDDLDTLDRQRKVLELQAIARELQEMLDDEVDFGFAELSDERMPVREIAQETNVPRSTVQQSIDRVRRPGNRTSRKSRAPKQRQDIAEQVAA